MTYETYEDDSVFSGIDFSEPEEQGDFALIPDGTYPMIAVKTEFKTNNNDTGNYLNVQFKLTQQYRGRVAFNKFNIVHQNQKCQNIGRGQFRALVAATLGKEAAAQMTNPSWALIHAVENVEFMGKVETQPASGIYKAQNVVTGFYPMPAQQQAAPVQQYAPTRPAQPAVPQDNASPWDNAPPQGVTQRPANPFGSPPPNARPTAPAKTKQVWER